MSDQPVGGWPVPAFRVPFDEEQLVLMGLIGVVWGQIDFWLNQILQNLHGIDHTQRRLLLGDKTVGPKLDIIQKSLERCESQPAREAVSTAVEAVRNTLVRRNAAAHGMWGLWTGSAAEHIPSVHTRPGQTPVLTAQDLRTLYDDVANASALVDAAYCTLTGQMEHVRGRTFFFGPTPPNRPGNIA